MNISEEATVSYKETELPPKTMPDNLTDNQNFVVSLHFFEQLMASAYNFVQLQCWAKTLHTNFSISVVEPHVRHNHSILGFTFENTTLPMAGDVFDLNSWRTQWPKKGGPLSRMISKAEFLHNIYTFKKNVILVDMDYKVTTNKAECNFSWDISGLKNSLKHYPLLNITRKVCLYGFAPTLAKDFEDLIVGDIRIQNTVIIFREWRGLKQGNDKIRMKIPQCAVDRVKSTYSLLQPSATVLKDAEMYANKYLGGFNQYVSVAARFELVAWDYWRLTTIQRRRAVTGAGQEAMLKVKVLKERAGVEKVYLSYDYGKLGSQTFEHLHFYHSSDLLEKFQEDLYDGILSYKEYNQSMLTFSFQNKGYIAMVQMTLASKGKCLLRIGWGHCIDFVTGLYKLYHPDKLQCLACSPKSVCF